MLDDTRVLAESNGYALAQRGPVLLFVNRGTSVISTAGFVVGLMTLVLGANALAQLGLLLLRSHPGGLSITVALLATTALFVFGAWRLRALLLDRRALPPEDVQVLALIDLEESVLLDADGTPLAPLDTVTFQRRFQLTASATALAASWPGGSRLVAAGNVFGGTVGPIESALRDRGL